MRDADYQAPGAALYRSGRDTVPAHEAVAVRDNVPARRENQRHEWRKEGP